MPEDHNTEPAHDGTAGPDLVKIKMPEKRQSHGRQIYSIALTQPIHHIQLPRSALATVRYRLKKEYTEDEQAEYECEPVGEREGECLP